MIIIGEMLNDIVVRQWDSRDEHFGSKSWLSNSGWIAFNKLCNLSEPQCLTCLKRGSMKWNPYHRLILSIKSPVVNPLDSHSKLSINV